MWTMSMDMSRDECIKCLRCLELDAYGNMVSVLRAQGPFTEEKKRLLDELAKVLHISNERHRAEIRRAVNDEKLSFIAEQLNGPNTWTDWAIEGRRTIPLLPRLEARTAFTELANSLSLVIAAANEKKVPVTEKHTEPILNSNKIVKSETDSYKESNVEENLPPKSLSSNPPRSTRGRKRKRPPDITDTTANIKIYPNNKASKIDDYDEINGQHQNIPSPLPNNWLRKMSEIESVAHTETTSKDSINETDFVNDITCTVSLNTKCRNNSTSSKYLNNNGETIPQTNITAVDVKLDTDLQSDRTHPLNNDTDNSNNQIISKQMSNLDIGFPENTQSSSAKIIEKLPNILQCKSTNSIISNVKQETTINSIDKVVLSGPGPPTQINASVMTYKKFPLDNFNYQSLTKEIKVNSNHTFDSNTFSNSKFNTRANLIVVQKVPTQSIKISRAGKEVLGKVIMDSKNLYLSKSEATSLTLLPRKSLSNNSDQMVNLVPMLNVNSSNVEIVKSNVNSSNIVMLDIQQDVPEKSNSLSISHKNSEITINSNTKTVSYDSDTDHLIEDYNEERLSPSTENLDIIFTDTNASSEENELNDTCIGDGLEIQSSSENPLKRNSSFQEILMIADSDGEEESQEVLDAQTEIYNFESNENICEIQIEETIPETTVQTFDTPLDSANINLEDFNYVETDGETVIIQADEEEIICSMGEELNELNNSE